jgi:hypothetical protein
MSALSQRVKEFEAAAAAAADAKAQAAKISETSDRSKYKYAAGMAHDLALTRAALRDLVLAKGTAVGAPRAAVTFGELYTYQAGEIANLNKVLQNLKKAGELESKCEIFFAGKDDKQEIVLLAPFWAAEYAIDNDNVFRNKVKLVDVPEQERRGRSYVSENLASRGVHDCLKCGEDVEEMQRVTVRGKVIHMRCIKCVQCGASPRVRADFVTFDGQLACSPECIQRYDGSHQTQRRG